MKNSKKIFLFEAELTKGSGHHYDQLVENSIYYKERGEIYWIVNKNFNSKDLYIPKFVKILKCINSAKRNFSKKKPYELFLITLGFFSWSLS